MADDIEQRVARWILLCDRGAPSERERAAFEAWLAADSSHRVAYIRLAQAWKATAALKVWRPHDGSIDTTVLRRSAMRSPNSRHWRWAAAAVAGLACVLLAILAAFNVQAPESVYSTQIGGYQRVLLEDGSAIQLNTNSEVRVRLLKNRRMVRLLRGEAYFDIAHDANRPFDVSAGGSIVRAIGTAFSVRLRDPEQIEVAVTQGRVAISSSGLVPTLMSQVAAGEVARARHSEVVIVRTDSTNLKRRLAWEEGELVFKKERLAEVVAEMNRYKHRQIAISDAALNDLEVGGNFKSTDLDSFVDAVNQSLNIKADESGGVIHLSVNGVGK